MTRGFVTFMFSALIILEECVFAEAKVKCHECQDTERGWCPHTALCEDAFCFKANVTLNQGQKHLRLGCVSAGKVGCEKQELQVAGMADVYSDYCVCDSDYCNAVPRPSSAVSIRVVDYRLVILLCLGQSGWRWMMTAMAAIFVYRG